jgi:small-conductance mechanosensitive channel
MTRAGIDFAHQGTGLRTEDGRQLLENATHSLAALVTRIAESMGVSEQALQRSIFHDVTWADLAVSGVLLVFVAGVHALIFLVFRRRRTAPQREAVSWPALIVRAALKPLYLALWIYGVYLVLIPVLLRLRWEDGLHPVHAFFEKLAELGIFIALFWFLFRFATGLDARMKQWAERTPGAIDDLLVPLLGRSLRIAVPVLAIIFALPLLGLPEEYELIVSRASSILIIGTIAWVLIQGLNTGERFVLRRYDITQADNLAARRMFTQVLVVKKTILVLIIVFTVASILMLFEEMRRLGTSILASAGVLGIILGFAAQRTIANVFAGLQLALTQPIRIDDVVIVENEWGRIEEITLTYVVVRIWDLRRLVVPISYFIEKPFQNWTRTSADILGTVLFYTDYTIPVEAVREEFKRIVERSQKWDRKVAVLQVTNATEQTLELRALISAKDAGSAWDLRCEVRENLIAFIQKTFPESLPKMRALLHEPESKPKPT